jgi:hypothetical protein
MSSLIAEGLVQTHLIVVLSGEFANSLFCDVSEL